VGIVEELVEIWPNEVCDRSAISLSRFYPIMDLERSPSMTFFLDLMLAHPVRFLRYQHELWVGSPLLNVFIIW